MTLFEAFLLLGSERSLRSLSPPRCRLVPGGTDAGRVQVGVLR